LRSNESDSLVVERVGQVISIAWHSVVIAKQIPFPVILSAVRETEEQIESSPVRRIVVRIRDVVPLADERFLVAPVTELVTEGFLGQIEPVEPAIARHIHNPVR
jgi:hypothetical protein